MPDTARDPIAEADAAFAAALQWLPLWTDRQRGLLRSRLTRARLVCREREAPAAVGAKVVAEKPIPTEVGT